jgi:hypothetical protein
MIVNSEWARMWKEAVIDQFNVMFQNLPQGLRGTMKTSFGVADVLPSYTHWHLLDTS